jgi:hypothetical protein
MDPNVLGFERVSYNLTKKYDIYSLGVLFWFLTSRKSPFDFETRNIEIIIVEILNGVREKPVPGTNSEFVKLYQSKYKM